MSWERRRHSRGRYYTRSRRESGLIVREYVGRGILGEMAAQADAAQRRQMRRSAGRCGAAQADAAQRIQKQEQRRIWRKQRGDLETQDAALRALDAACEAVLAAVLTASGYHQHQRGEWRKRRERK
jgi:hypothetical protein